MSSYYEDDTIGIIYRNAPESSKHSSKKHKRCMNTPSVSDSNILNTSECNLDFTLSNRDGIEKVFNNIKESVDNSDKYGCNPSVMNNLKDSIRSSFKSMKLDKEKYSNKVTIEKLAHNSEKTTIDSKRKTEREKLYEYYKGKHCLKCFRFESEFETKHFEYRKCK